MDGTVKTGVHYILEAQLLDFITTIQQMVRELKEVHALLSLFIYIFVDSGNISCSYFLSENNTVPKEGLKLHH